MIGAEKFRLRNMIGRFAAVDQSEVASIVGMSPGCEAEWLAAGEMPWRLGQEGQISIVQVVELLIKFELSKFGCRPSENRSTIGKAIAPVFYNAFCLVQGALQVTGMTEDVDCFRCEFAKSTSLASELTGGPHYYSCLYKRHDNQEVDLAHDLAALLNGVDKPRISYLEFREVSARVCAKVRRPLLSIEFQNKFPSSKATGVWLSEPPSYQRTTKWNVA